VRESWQNEFRKHDFALELIGGAHNAEDTIKEIKRILSDEGLFERIELNYSGYAVHISPKGAGKLAGLKYLLSMQGINISRVAGIGDSAMDWDFIRETGIKVAVSNADEELKEKSDIITDYESGFGFAQLCKAIAEAKLVKDQR
jgi:hydroxymethylpyrimidine pyrophosphatase-like HAD family hydrolase